MNFCVRLRNTLHLTNCATRTLRTLWLPFVAKGARWVLGTREVLCKYVITQGTASEYVATSGGVWDDCQLCIYLVRIVGH